MTGLYGKSSAGCSCLEAGRPRDLNPARRVAAAGRDLHSRRARGGHSSRRLLVRRSRGVLWAHGVFRRWAVRCRTLATASCKASKSGPCSLISSVLAGRVCGRALTRCQSRGCLPVAEDRRLLLQWVAPTRIVRDPAEKLQEEDRHVYRIRRRSGRTQAHAARLL